MGLFDKLIKDMTGGNNGNSNSYSNYNSGSVNMRPKSMYQCRYCGMRYQTNDTRFLPHGGTGCRARGSCMGKNRLDERGQDMLYSVPLS